MQKSLYPMPDPSDPKWREELIRRLQIQRQRVKVVRIMAIVFAFISVGGGLIFSFLGADALSANAIRIANGPEGQVVIAKNVRSALDSSPWHWLGVVGEKDVAWGEKASGELADIEFNQKGEVLAYFSQRVLIYASLDDALHNKEPRKREVYGPNTPRSIAAIPYQDGIVSARLTNSKLYAGLGGETPIVPTAIDLDVGSAAYAWLFEIAPGRFQLIAHVRTATKGSSDKPRYRIFAVAFNVEKKATQPATESAAPADAETESATAPALPEVLGADASGYYYEASNVAARQLLEGVAASYVVACADGIMIFYRAHDAEKYSMIFGQESEWGEAQEVGPHLQDALAAMVKQTTPFFGPSVTTLERLHLYRFGDSLRHYALDVSEGEITIWQASATKGVVGEFKEVGRFQVSSALISFPPQLFMTLMAAAFFGLIGCMVWLGLNRPHRLEEVMRTLVETRVGRDIMKLEPPVGQPLDLLIPWAGLFRRTIAFFIDLAVLIPAVYLVTSMTNHDPKIALNILDFDQASIIDGLMERLVTLSLFALYGFICETLWGRTLGKRILGMRVVTSKGQGPSTIQLFLRNLLRTIELCTPLLMVGAMFSIIFTQKHQRLGDLLARTAVRIEARGDDDNSVQEPSDL